MEKENEIKEEIKTSVRQEQVHDILFSREIGWQEIIYDLINTEQLDPWDINITILTEKFMERVQKLEEADFFISSKVLLAAALLLRIKSEILLNKYIKSIDDILFGKKEDVRKPLERIELDDEIPELIPRSPMPRFRKVTLQELMESLNKAIITENRRIKKEIVNNNALRETAISLPKIKISIKDKIKEIYDKIFGHLGTEEKHKVTFTELIGENKEERIISFGPLLHLENQHKVWLEQEKHFGEIQVWLKDVYWKKNGDPYEQLKIELESEFEKELEKNPELRARLENIDEEIENPLGKLAEGKEEKEEEKE